MRKRFFPLLFLLSTSGIIFTTCQRELHFPNQPPIANAGKDTTIILPTDIAILDGSASHDPDNNIRDYAWRKISGPSSSNIHKSSAAEAEVDKLSEGVYQFELKVADAGGLFSKDTMAVAVVKSIPGNRAPVANAGQDQTITLPTNAVSLDESGSTDADNNITSYAWTKIAGPSSFNILNANTTQTQVTNLVEGVYQFELKVTDAAGLFDADTMQVTVSGALSQSDVCDTDRPVINAHLIPVGTLSQARLRLAVASVGNKILFAGGDRNVQYSESSRVDIFDIAANTWSTAELSFPRVWIAAIAAGNKIFFAGGQNDGDSYDNVDIYDASANSWTVSHLSRQADALAAATVGTKVFFAGGNWGIYAVNIVDVYDLATNSWSTAHLSAARNFITAVSTGNKVYFSGGDPWTAQTSNVIDIYDNTSNAWSISTLQIPRGYHAAAAVNDILYFVGGKTSYNSQPTCSVETLDAITGTRAVMNLFGPGSWSIDEGQNAVVKNNKIIFLRHDGSANANKFDIYDTQANTWLIGVFSQPMPTGASVISVNNTIYVAGGSVNGVLSNQVWKLEF